MFNQEDFHSGALKNLELCKLYKSTPREYATAQLTGIFMYENLNARIYNLEQYPIMHYIGEDTKCSNHLRVISIGRTNSRRNIIVIDRYRAIIKKKIFLKRKNHDHYKMVMQQKRPG